jgi:CBS domain-containing protein
MKAADVMTDSVISVDPDHPVEQVARLMLEHGISAVPVIGAHGQLLGIVSEGDLMRRGELGTQKRRSWWLNVLADKPTLAAEYTKARARKARDVMTHPVVSVEAATPIVEIVELLEKHNIKRVPVVSDGRVVGIVSRANLLRAFASRASKGSSPVANDDQAIRERLLKHLGRQPWWSERMINIVVTDGKVHFWGFVESQEQRDAMRVAAENIPGVRAMKDHMTLDARVLSYGV